MRKRALGLKFKNLPEESKLAASSRLGGRARTAPWDGRHCEDKNQSIEVGRGNAQVVRDRDPRDVIVVASGRCNRLGEAPSRSLGDIRRRRRTLDPVDVPCPVDRDECQRAFRQPRFMNHSRGHVIEITGA